MGEKLLIVESPTKARTISKMLGGGYKIMASMGHVRDLPERTFGVDIEHDFAPLYTDTPRSKKIVSELKSAAKKADAIYLAPDPDREGEAIAWHLSEVLRPSYKGEFKRVTFHEITRSAINRALSEEGSINMNLVDAQQARRVLDRIVGYQVSPLLWSKIAKGISAGRVQSVALRLVVERERQVLAFVPEEYWVVSVRLRTDRGEEFEARLLKINREDFRIPDEKSGLALLDNLSGSDFAIQKITSSDRKRQPQPPFTTSTLQQAANNTLHYSATNTMRYAQQLYEGVDLGDGSMVGLITYMRTDSVNIAKEAQDACLAYIKTTFGADYTPERPNRYKSKSSAQEAHEAIRPTDVTRTPESLSSVLEGPQLKLYTLIWKRFVASQMAPALQRQMAVDVNAVGRDRTDYLFRANASITLFPGFTRLYADTRKSDDAAGIELFGKLQEGERCQPVDFAREQKFTEPPPRYTEATLIKELEENGIGRPSTYATILRTIQSREYVNRDQGKLIPTELGFQVSDFLVGVLPELFKVDFTSHMETELDEIEAGSLKWTAMLREFYNQFIPWLNQAKVAGAPAADQVSGLLERLSRVEFLPPEKRGKRTYDDRKFLNSVSGKFETDRTISAKQFQSLLELAVKYRRQIPDLEQLAGQQGFDAELTEAIARQSAMAQKQLDSAVSDDKAAEYREIFEAFQNVNWEEPQTRRGRTYDDKKFFNSLKNQAESGKMLSEKQFDALRRLAEKYREQLEAPERLTQLLALKPADADAAPEPADEECAALIQGLETVSAWAEPTTKGRRTYDDKSFFQSLADQFHKGRKLSDKQLAALKKLAGKYLK